MQGSGRSARRVLVTLGALALVVASCGGDDDDGPSASSVSRAESTTEPVETTTATAAVTAPPSTAAPMPSAAQLGTVALSLQLVNGDIQKATSMAWKEGDPAPYVTTQTGALFRVENGVATQILDLSGEVPVYEPGSEQGLLGIAFDPRDGRMFLHFNDRNGDTHLVSYANESGTIDTASRRDVLTQDQPGIGHKGGQLLFDDDGNLYMGLGDGGGSRGRDAQDMTKLLGTILRITPKLDAPGYDVPEDNPFVGTPNVRPEFWAKGLRNPWKFSIDEPTGDLWIGDVGEDDIEEIDVMRAGESGLNFGWYFYEGTTQRQPTPPPGLTPPVHEYPHSTGIAVMGGWVYRGTAIPGLVGAYLFGDVNGTMWAMGADGVVTLPVEVAGTFSGFGQGPDGELYALSLSKGIYAIRPA